MAENPKSRSLDEILQNLISLGKQEEEQQNEIGRQIKALSDILEESDDG